MFRNYLKIAVRNLRTNRVFSLINIFGLAIGLSMSVLILTFVVHEFSFDQFHANSKNIFRVVATFRMGDQQMQFKSFPAHFGSTIKASSAHVRDYVRVRENVGSVVMRNPDNPDGIFSEQKLAFTDPSFFSVFTFSLKSGDVAHVLEKPFSMVISERAARKYFGDQDPVGQVLEYEGKHMMQITGVIENPPSNSTIDLDFIVSNTTIPQLSAALKKDYEQSGMFDTYLLLDTPASVATVSGVIQKVGKSAGVFDEHAVFRMEAFTSTHLGNNFRDSGNGRLIYIFMGIAGIVLFLALFNYMSLTTARATIRAKEVGVRKVVGAGRSSLLVQFYVESALVCFIAFVLCFLSIQVARQPFEDMLGLHVDTSFLFSARFLTIVGALLLFCIFLAGSYPALILSGFAPLEVLRGKIGGGQRGSGVRRTLMVIQFTASVSLIICTLVVKTQLNYMQQKRLGFHKDQVLAVPLGPSVKDNLKVISNEIGAMAGVRGVTASNAGFFKGYNMFFEKNEVTGKEVGLVNFIVDQQFTKVMGLEFNQSPANETWKNREYVLLNERAVKELGFRDASIGKRIGGRHEVAGLLKDFHFSSVRDEVRPVALFVMSDTTNILRFPPHQGVLYVRLNPAAAVQSQVEGVTALFKKHDPGHPFEYYFLNDAFNETFKTEIRMSKMVTVFTGFAVFIACMGLFGLVTFAAETRTREIGIRKVLGASVSSIVTLVSSDFIKLVLLSVVLAVPLAWYAMSRWLEDFSYRVEIPWWALIAAAGLALFVALATISFQSISAAMKDPVRSLRAD